LDSKTRSEIDEFSTSGFIGVKKDGEDITLVVPDSKNVISSVTSDSCLDISKSFGWKVERRSVSLAYQFLDHKLTSQIKYEELPEFNEVLAAGTAAALVPIKSITRNTRNETFSYIPADSEEPGPICIKLLTTLKGIQAGKIKDTFGWNSKVEEVDIKKYTTGETTNGVNGKSVDALP
jgi:branched-chain amino acid aminotransferase